MKQLFTLLTPVIDTKSLETNLTGYGKIVIGTFTHGMRIYVHLKDCTKVLIVCNLSSYSVG